MTYAKGSDGCQSQDENKMSEGNGSNVSDDQYSDGCNSEHAWSPDNSNMSQCNG